MRIQPKLQTSQPGDLYEQEADKIADQIITFSPHPPHNAIASLTSNKVKSVARKCAACEMREDDEENIRISKKSSSASYNGTVRDVMSEVNMIRSNGGSPIEPSTQEFMESYFGHDFSKVRIHTDERSARSARYLGAHAYTIGHDIVFGQKQYRPDTLEGRKLLAHELTHVVQQDGQQQPVVGLQENNLMEPTSEGGYRITIAPWIKDEPHDLEYEANAVADRSSSFNKSSSHGSIAQKLLTSKRATTALQRYRLELPGAVPLCGRMLTHLDLELPRWRPLEPCLPRTTLVYRANIVGREVSSRTTGRGRIIFNLHIGYYRDPTTGRLCAIASDSLGCIAPKCLVLGCFPTLREVIEAILDFLKDALKAIGILILIILAVLIGRWFMGRPGSAPVPGEAPLFAEASDQDEAEEIESEV